MKKHIYIYEKVLAFALAFAMIVGFWSGITLDVRAASKYIRLCDYEDGKNFNKVKDFGIITADNTGDIGVLASSGDNYTANIWLMNAKKEDYSTATHTEVTSFGSEEGYTKSFYIRESDKITQGSSYYLQVMVSVSGGKYNVYFYLTKCNDYVKKTIDITVQSPEGGVELPSEAPTSYWASKGTIRWKENGNVVDYNVAKYDTRYTMEIQYDAADGYVFADNVTAKVNNESASFEIVAGTDNKSCLVTYTFPATGSAPVQEINSVAITIEKPEAEKALPTVGNGVSVSTPGVKVDDVIWYKGKGSNPVTGTAGYNTTYTATVILILEENSNYQFAPPVQVTINDKERGSFELSNGKLLITNVDFPATAPDPAKTINSIDINIDLPVGGQPFPSEVPSLSNATGMIEWMKLGGVRVSGLAEYDTKYIAQIEYEAMNGYVFADNATATVNGEPASFTIIEGTNNKNCLITRTFQTAKEGQAQTISNIEITVPKPAGGQKMPSLSEVTQRVTGAKANKILWCEGDNTEGKPYVTENAKYNTVYTMKITYEAEDGYIFGDNTTATVNGNPIKFLITGFSNDKKGEVTYTFPATDPETTHTINSAAITVDSPEAGKQLPTVENGVKVSTTGVKVAKVEWSADGKAVTGLAGYNTVYTVKVYLDTEDNYEFGTDMSATVNNMSTTVSADGNSKYVTYTFPKTETEPVQMISSIEITAPQPEAGQKLPYFPDVTHETTEAKGTGINWYEGKDASGADVAGKEAEYNTVYTMSIRYEAKDGFVFGSNTTATVNGNMAGCEMSGTDVCYVTYTFPATGAEPSGGDYKIIEGNNSNYVPGSDKPLSFRGDGEFNEFLRVEVDGKIVEEKYYTKEAGSTIITFTPEYLATLSEGSHTVKMVWGVNGEEKSAAGSFYIGEKGGEIVPGNTGTTQPANDSESKPRHICNFEWVITLDPTTGADGLEEYKCTGCGAVSESHPIPASVALIKDFYGKVKQAPEKGSITYDSGKLYTISDYVLKKMAERNDVSVTVKFEYKNKKFQLTFPAGLDYSAVLTDKETMYGYFGVAAKLGLKVTEQ